MIHKYVCITCSFITHTAQQWQGKTFRCPSCGTIVELRPYVEDDKMFEGIGKQEVKH